jgi:hypothetical protein
MRAAWVDNANHAFHGPRGLNILDQLIGGAPVHARQHIALLDGPATLRPNSGHAPLRTAAHARRATVTDASGVAVV